MALRRRQIALCLSFLAVVIAVAGCGSSGGSEDLTGEPFTAEDGAAFTGALAELKDRIAAGDCDGAQDKLDALVTGVNMVPADTDQGLKNDLLDLLDELGGQVTDQCMPADESTSTTDTDETSTDETSTSTTTTTTDDTQTDTSTTDQTDTDTSETEPDIPSPPDNTPPGQGGTPPGQGGTPPGGGGNGGGSGGITPRSAP